LVTRKIIFTVAEPVEALVKMIFRFIIFGIIQQLMAITSQKLKPLIFRFFQINQKEKLFL
jgi:hypothetical protein